MEYNGYFTMAIVCHARRTRYQYSKHSLDGIDMADEIENRQGRRAITISDVADSVGVATSTVSRALSNPERVSPETRTRILEAAKRLGYHPNLHARSLISGKTRSIALVVPGVPNPYFFDIIRGTQTQVKKRQYRHILIDTEESEDIETAALEELVDTVDGVVLAGSRLPDEHLHAFAERLPMVVLNREIEGVPSVIVDTVGAHAEALEYLVSLGHTHIAYIAGPAHSWSSNRRWSILKETARRIGISCEKIGPFSSVAQSSAAAADTAVHLGVTACLFFNDMMALMALKRFKELGVSVPSAMSIVGCDDIFGADFCNPPLTTITAPIEQVARTATDMLLSRLENDKQSSHYERVRIPASLNVRASTARKSA